MAFFLNNFFTCFINSFVSPQQYLIMMKEKTAKSGLINCQF